MTFDLDTLGRDFFDAALDSGQERELRRATYSRVVPRILDWLDRVGVRATFFVIGSDAAAHAQEVRGLAARGHEVANHTWSHPKNFSTLEAGAIADEIRRAHAALAAATGVEPVGFRAPGYTITPQVLAALRAAGYRYDASLVPSWSYSAIKHAFRIVGGARYRRALFVQPFAAAFSPKGPFQIDAGSASTTSVGVRTLTEIPLTTLPVGQLPLIYGLYGRYGPAVHRAMEWAVSHRRFMSLAFHDFELATATDFGPQGPGRLSAPHARIPIERRLEWITASVNRLQRNFRFAPLSSVAECWQHHRA